MLPNIIRLPNEREVQTIMREFEEIPGFPQAVGTVDGCHIRIKAPVKDADDYVNRKDRKTIEIKPQIFVSENLNLRSLLTNY